MADEVDADAFKRLYPDQYYARFLAEGVRPDGRPLGRARAVTIGAGAITTAAGSALVKVGRSSVLAGVRLDIIRPDETAPGAGQLTLNVEPAPFSSADYRPGRAPDHVSSVAEKVTSALLAGDDAVQLSSLCIAEGKAAWRATLDVYILDSDGAMLDTALLACVAALRDTRIPPVKATREGQYFAAGGERDRGGGAPVAGSPTRVGLARAPLALTCCLYGGHVLVDPTAEEERLAGGGLTVVCDQEGTLQGVYKAGGRVLADAATLTRCVEAARLRYRDVAGLLEAGLAGAQEAAGQEAAGQA